ncbi:hypothetical protein [Pseudoalteromonas sp. S558]|uniref:hypothetical protein n=1 Tax=Pseudoalteromonas sp. S558 TaxID=2066515 RepID=UPI001486EBED|nr:hypothetical protein [Pseudoalteromonas sp. S558]
MLDKKEKKAHKDVSSKIELIEETLLKNVGGGIETCSVNSCIGGINNEVCSVEMPVLKP